jgi:hypothetical protein
MTDLDLPRIQTTELFAEATVVGGDLTVTFRGSADSQVMEPLDVMLVALHKHALAAKAREVVVDFRGLEFMNSSCFKAFVSWLSELQDVAEEAQYRIRILSDDNKHWQRRSLGALSCFAVDLIRIES